MNRGFLAAALAAALGLAGCVDGGFGHAFHDDVDVSKALSPSGRFSLRNINGNVRIAVWDKAQVRIEAEKAAASEHALRNIEVVVEGEGDRVDVRTRMPHGFHLFGSGGKVDYTVTVPRGASVSVNNVNGRVEIQDVSGAVKAENVNGSLEASGLAGSVEASTVNGGVQVGMARLDPSGHSRLSTTNGSVRVTLPSDAAADIEASTVNGSVHCDFDVDGHSTRHKVTGRIRGGGARFVLQTVNGSTRIDRGLSSAAPSAAGKAEAGS